MMSRSLSPVTLHVNRNAPVHVRLCPSPTGERIKRERSSPTRRMRASDWVRASTSKGPWVPPPAKTSRGSDRLKMSWEGASHRLEINPAADNTGETMLKLSDLDPNMSTDIIVEPAETQQTDPTTKRKLDSLLTEVGALRAEVDLQRSLRELDSQPHQRSSPLDDPMEDSHPRRSPSVRKLQQNLSDSKNTMLFVNTQRDQMCSKMIEVEMDCSAVTGQTDIMRESLRKLLKDKSMSPSRVREAAEQSKLLLDKLGDLELSTKTLKRLVKSLQKHEVKVHDFLDQQEMALQRLADAESLVSIMKAQLEDKDALSRHSQQLHDQLSQSEVEAQQLGIRVQSLSEKLHQKELECMELDGKLREAKRSAQIDKEVLKKATKQHKERAARRGESLEVLGQQVEELTSELETQRTMSSRMSREKLRTETEVHSLTTQVRELEEALTQSRLSNRSSMEILSGQLTSRARDISAVQLENDRLKSSVASLEGKLSAVESATISKMSVAQSEVAELQATVTQYDGILAEYKSQLDQAHLETRQLSGELRRKEEEIEQLNQDRLLEMETSRLKLQQHRTEFKPIQDQLKQTEAKMREALERLAIYEQRNAEQIKRIAELTTKSEHNNVTVSELKERLQEASADSKTTSARLEASERRLTETDKQNRELITITSKKEEVIQRLQKRSEELLQEIARLNEKMDNSKSEGRRQVEELRDRLTSKERSNIAHIAELEQQLSRANSHASQLRTTKDETERKLQTRIHNLQEQLDQAMATKRSLENYINFLKTSYSTVFTSSSPLPHQ